MAEFQLEFVPIETLDDPRWDFVERLFTEAFPPDERREFGVQRHLAAFEDRFKQCVVKNGDQMVAIISYWRLDCGNYLEHIATSSDVRGGGLGAAIIEHLLATVANSWFGEVELPLDELCRRRIGFYERLGFVGHPTLAYQQPSYGVGKQPIDMMIMSVGDIEINKESLGRIVEEMSRTVYGTHKF